MDVRIRPWVEDDAEALAAAVAESLAELRPWMPWASAEPQSVEARRAWIRACADDPDDLYAIVADGAIAGSCGLHHRIGPRGLELGYWVTTPLTGRGIATATVGLLTREAFSRPGIDHVEIHHDTANAASAAVARRAGFTHITTDPGHRFADRAPTTIWRLTRAQWEA
jgi:ribosomal-protein-serine acetyltransferase